MNELKPTPIAQLEDHLVFLRLAETSWYQALHESLENTSSLTLEVSFNICSKLEPEVHVLTIKKKPEEDDNQIIKRVKNSIGKKLLKLADELLPNDFEVLRNYNSFDWKYDEKKAEGKQQRKTLERPARAVDLYAAQLLKKKMGQQEIQEVELLFA